MAVCVSRFIWRSSKLGATAASRLSLNSQTQGQTRSIAWRGFATSRLSSAVFFTKKHEWISVDDDKTTGTVGITHYAQEALGDVVYAQLPEPDESVEAGVDCGALESVKAASEIYSPCSGTVVEKNETVEAGPALINKSAENEGWLFKIKLTTPEEIDALMDRAAYDDYLKTQEDDH